MDFLEKEQLGTPWTELPHALGTIYSPPWSLEKRNQNPHLERAEGGKGRIVRASKCFCWLGPLQVLHKPCERENGAYIVQFAIVWDGESLNEFVSLLTDVFYIWWPSVRCLQSQSTYRRIPFKNPLDAHCNHLWSFDKVRCLGLRLGESDYWSGRQPGHQHFKMSPDEFNVQLAFRSGTFEPHCWQDFLIFHSRHFLMSTWQKVQNWI